MKEKLVKTLKWFAKIWGFLWILSVVASAITVLITKGWLEFIWLFDPLNIANYFVMLLILAPAIVAHYFSEYLLKNKI